MWQAVPLGFPWHPRKEDGQMLCDGPTTPTSSRKSILVSCDYGLFLTSESLMAYFTLRRYIHSSDQFFWSWEFVTLRQETKGCLGMSGMFH